MEDGEHTFHWNDYSWNREVNMLYIESPAGVGFSYCLDQYNCLNEYNDNISGNDNLHALLFFLENKFPELKGHDLYLSGESYAGIYVPYLANEIYEYNKKYENDTSVFKPNLKGYMVGNGVTNWTYDCDPAYIEMGYWHGLYNK